MASGLSLEWVQGCGKQTSEGQEGKENVLRRETPVGAETFRTVTQQKGGLALSPILADLLLNEGNSGRAMYTFNRLSSHIPKSPNCHLHNLGICCPFF